MNNHIKPVKVFFRDKSIIDQGTFTRNSIRLDPEKKTGDENTYKLLNRQQK